MNVEDIYKDILELPEPIQDQVRDFVGYLKVKYSSRNGMSEEKFWELIESIEINDNTPGDTIAPLVNQLSRLSIEDIYEYQDILAAKLSQLDSPKFWEVGGGSSDSFLYSRCYVVAKGKSFFRSVLQDPLLFPSNPLIQFEDLLSTPYDAYELKTGEELERTPSTNYETMFNVENWGTKAIQL